MARDVNDTVVLGFGAWSDVNGLPTLGFGVGVVVETRSLRSPHRATADDNRLGTVSHNPTSTATDRRLGTIVR